MSYQAENRATWPLGCWNAYVAAPLDPREAARRIAEAPFELQERLRSHRHTVELIGLHHIWRNAALAYRDHLNKCKVSNCMECNRLAREFLAAKEHKENKHAQAAG